MTNCHKKLFSPFSNTYQQVSFGHFDKLDCIDGTKYPLPGYRLKQIVNYFRHGQTLRLYSERIKNLAHAGGTHAKCYGTFPLEKVIYPHIFPYLQSKRFIIRLFVYLGCFGVGFNPFVAPHIIGFYCRVECKTYPVGEQNLSIFPLVCLIQSLQPCRIPFDMQKRRDEAGDPIFFAILNYGKNISTHFIFGYKQCQKQANRFYVN